MSLFFSRKFNLMKFTLKAPQFPPPLSGYWRVPPVQRRNISEYTMETFFQFEIIYILYYIS